MSEAENSSSLRQAANDVLSASQTGESSPTPANETTPSSDGAKGMDNSLAFATVRNLANLSSHREDPTLTPGSPDLLGKKRANLKRKASGSDISRSSKRPATDEPKSNDCVKLSLSSPCAHADPHRGTTSETNGVDIDEPFFVTFISGNISGETPEGINVLPCASQREAIDLNTSAGNFNIGGTRDSCNAEAASVHKDDLPNQLSHGEETDARSMDILEGLVLDIENSGSKWEELNPSSETLAEADQAMPKVPERQSSAHGALPEVTLPFQCSINERTVAANLEFSNLEGRLTLNNGLPTVPLEGEVIPDAQVLLMSNSAGGLHQESLDVGTSGDPYPELRADLLDLLTHADRNMIPTKIQGTRDATGLRQFGIFPALELLEEGALSGNGTNYASGVSITPSFLPNAAPLTVSLPGPNLGQRPSLSMSQTQGLDSGTAGFIHSDHPSVQHPILFENMTGGALTTFSDGANAGIITIQEPTAVEAPPEADEAKIPADTGQPFENIRIEGLNNSEGTAQIAKAIGGGADANAQQALGTSVFNVGDTVWRGEIHMEGHRRNSTIKIAFAAMFIPSEICQALSTFHRLPPIISLSQKNMGDLTTVLRNMTPGSTHGLVRFVTVRKNGSERRNRYAIQLIEQVDQMKAVFKVPCACSPEGGGTLYIWSAECKPYGMSFVAVCVPSQPEGAA